LPNNLELNAAEKEAVEHAESNGLQSYLVEIHFSKNCEYKSIRANMAVTRIAEIADIVKTVPDQKEMDEKNLESGFKIVVTSKFGKKKLKILPTKSVKLKK
jgi:hypothetical protein